MEGTNEVSLLPEEIICDDKQYMACIYQLSGYFHLKKISDFYHQQYLWKNQLVKIIMVNIIYYRIKYQQHSHLVALYMLTRNAVQREARVPSDE